MISKHLPFPRGTTFSDAHSDGATTLLDDSQSGLEGKLYEVKDTLHGTGIPVILRCVKNDNSTTISTDYRCMSFSTSSATDFGSRVDGVANTKGEIAKPIDDFYAASSLLGEIPGYDLFYVVDSGMCDIKSFSGTATATSVGGMASVAGTGGYAAASADTGTAIGIAMEVSSTSANTAFLVNVMPSLWPGHAAADE